MRKSPETSQLVSFTSILVRFLWEMSKRWEAEYLIRFWISRLNAMRFELAMWSWASHFIFISSVSTITKWRTGRLLNWAFRGLWRYFKGDVSSNCKSLCLFTNVSYRDDESKWCIRKCFVNCKVLFMALLW